MVVFNPCNTLLRRPLTPDVVVAYAEGTMVDPIDEPLRVVRAFKKLSGGSQSTLVQCDDGNAYVVKSHPNPQGSNVLANEAIGSHLLQGLGIVSPPCRSILITKEDIQRNAVLRMQSRAGTYQPSAGLHFGSLHLGSVYCEITENRTPWLRRSATNQEDFNAMYLFDLWALHHDKRQYFYVISLASGEVVASFFDNGHLFGGCNWDYDSDAQEWDTIRRLKPPDVEIGAFENIIKIFKQEIPGLLSEIIPVIPAVWYSGDLGSLERMLLVRLSILRELVDKDYQRYANAVLADG